AWVFGELFSQCGEILTIAQALIEALREFLRSFWATDFTRLEQNMADMDFVTVHHITATLIQQLQHNDAACSTRRLSHLTDAHPAKQTIKRRRQLRRFTPAHFAAL